MRPDKKLSFAAPGPHVAAETGSDERPPKQESMRRRSCYLNAKHWQMHGTPGQAACSSRQDLCRSNQVTNPTHSFPLGAHFNTPDANCAKAAFTVWFCSRRL